MTPTVQLHNATAASFMTAEPGLAGETEHAKPGELATTSIHEGIFSKCAIMNTVL